LFVGEVVMRRKITPFLMAAQESGCSMQIGSDMLYEIIPAYLECLRSQRTTSCALSTRVPVRADPSHCTEADGADLA
jgi:shikimate 5-dehydrogenase